MLENLSQYKIILASKSPRRKNLLREMGLTFEVISADIDEASIKGNTPTETAVLIAQSKANAIIESFKNNELVITADTIVVLNNEVIGKPTSNEDAKNMLAILSGKMHEVITAVCIQTEKQKKVFSNSTLVYFKKLSTDEIEYYVDTYEPLDKAGAYGIQEWMGTVAVEKIEGS
ncbi:MAG: septum formation protein Maf, partial [Bacteroidia bacterium]|nr:septum formation protein Maf [Bacteroidia bacterium]